MSSGGPSSSSSSRRAGGGAGRVLAKLRQALDNGNYYEAHQMYKTLYFRYMGQKKFDECESLLLEGALALFDRDQVGSGVDLAKLYVQFLETGKREPSEARFKSLAELYTKIPVNSPEKNAFLSLAVRWASSSSSPSSAPPDRLHQLFAYSLWSIKRYPESRHHFLYSSDGSGCGSMLAEFHFSHGFPREVDLFVVGTVLQFLCLRKHIVAAFTLKSYTENHPAIKRGPPYAHPLLNFVWLLLVAIETKQSLSAYGVLVEKYRPSLKRDPSYLEYVDKIGQTFFGLPPPKRQPAGGAAGGMFSNIMDSLFNAMNDSSEESTSAGTNQPNSSSSPKEMETEDLD